jgi:FkbM family methyltransferase
LQCLRLVARSALLSRIYLAGVRLLTGPSVRRRVINVLSEVNWPTAAFRPRLVRVGGSTEFFLMPHNWEFDIEAVLGGQLSYEPEVFAFLDKVVDSYDTVIEIGANVGIFTLYLSNRLKVARPDARIFAFEPSAEAYRRLRENLGLNAAGNVTTLNAAIGHNSGFVRFYEPRGHLTNGSLTMSFAAYFDKDPVKSWIIALEGTSLLELLKAARHVLLKIDVEGFEAEVLHSLTAVIEQHRPDILIEVLPGFEEPINAALDFSALGYQFYGLTTDGAVAVERIRAVEGRDCFLTTRSDLAAGAPLPGKERL